ncbi:MAG: hypothetical protein H0V09_11550 [Gemmatimonadetes bacterium]|nr:hypothetical protein [Gemmatimonadota bacterium]
MVLPPPVPSRTPLLPWPFFGRRSLASLGAAGIAALPPGSPEHRLLAALDSRECADRRAAASESCLFLESGVVYEIRREPGADPPRFRLRRVIVGAPTADGEMHRVVEGRDPQPGVLLTLPAGAADTIGTAGAPP